jgi:hypothetical protein
MGRHVAGSPYPGRPRSTPGAPASERAARARARADLTQILAAA